VRLSKSDLNAQFDVVSFMPRDAGGESVYGPKLYGHLYEPERRDALLARARSPRGAGATLLRRLFRR
jgi:hypothetical protein